MEWNVDGRLDTHALAKGAHSRISIPHNFLFPDIFVDTKKGKSDEIEFSSIITIPIMTE